MKLGLSLGALCLLEKLAPQIQSALLLHPYVFIDSFIIHSFIVIIVFSAGAVPDLREAPRGRLHDRAGGPTDGGDHGSHLPGRADHREGRSQRPRAPAADQRHDQAAGTGHLHWRGDAGPHQRQLLLSPGKLTQACIAHRASVERELWISCDSMYAKVYALLTDFTIILLIQELD